MGRTSKSAFRWTAFKEGLEQGADEGKLRPYQRGGPPAPFCETFMRNASIIFQRAAEIRGRNGCHRSQLCWDRCGRSFNPGLSPGCHGTSAEEMKGDLNTLFTTSHGRSPNEDRQIPYGEKSFWRERELLFPVSRVGILSGNQKMKSQRSSTGRLFRRQLERSGGRGSSGTPHCEMRRSWRPERPWNANWSGKTCLRVHGGA